MRHVQDIMKAIRGESGAACKRTRLRFGIAQKSIQATAGVTTKAMAAYEAYDKRETAIPKATREAIGKALAGAIVNECLYVAFLVGGDTDPRLAGLRMVRLPPARVPGPNGGQVWGPGGVALIDKETGETFKREREDKA